MVGFTCYFSIGIQPEVSWRQEKCGVGIRDEWFAELFVYLFCRGGIERLRVYSFVAFEALCCNGKEKNNVSWPVPLPSYYFSISLNCYCYHHWYNKFLIRYPHYPLPPLPQVDPFLFTLSSSICNQRIPWIGGHCYGNNTIFLMIILVICLIHASWPPWVTMPTRIVFGIHDDYHHLNWLCLPKRAYILYYNMHVQHLCPEYTLYMLNILTVSHLYVHVLWILYSVNVVVISNTLSRYGLVKSLAAKDCGIPSGSTVLQILLYIYIWSLIV